METRSLLLQLYPNNSPPSRNVLCNVISLPLPSSSIPVPTLTLLANYLLQALQIHPTHPALPESLAGSTTLLNWVPHLSSLPPSHLDTLLTRAYTALTRTSPPPLVRAYALCCLASTSPGAVTSSSFWKHASALEDPSSVVEAAVARKDAPTFLSGSPFVSFCENWAAAAKQVSDH